METVASDTSASVGQESVLVDLALQGGGSHGAFTWGVLDRLLEEPWLRIDGISGTSAGAMNAVVLVDGYEKDGPEGARAALEGFWRRVLAFRPVQSHPAKPDGYHPWPVELDKSPSSSLSTWRRACFRLMT